MSQTFGAPYNPQVSLALTWTEQFQLFEDEDETIPVDLTGLDVQAQLRASEPVSAVPTPIIEFTTADFYVTPPAWPVVECFSIPDQSVDANKGKIEMSINRENYASVVSSTNEKVKLFWEIVLVNKGTLERAPVIKGKVSFRPAVTTPVT